MWVRQLRIEVQSSKVGFLILESFNELASEWKKVREYTKKKMP